MAGYDVYSGIGGVPYSVGSTGQTQAQQGVQTGADGSVNPIQNPSQEQTSPGAYGAASYAGLMPQWMQDYFDAHLAGNGFQSLDSQRGLAVNDLASLKNKYGEQAAMNPYFTTVGGMDKGFDPFNYDVVQNTTQNGRWADYNPQFTYNRTQTQGRDPFSGAVKNTSYSYDQTYGNGGDSGYDSGYNGTDAKRDALTGGLYSMNKGLASGGKKLWG